MHRPCHLNADRATMAEVVSAAACRESLQRDTNSRMTRGGAEQLHAS